MTLISYEGFQGYRQRRQNLSALGCLRTVNGRREHHADCLDEQQVKNTSQCVRQEDLGAVSGQWLAEYRQDHEP
jgi:hypothetical protein